MQRMEMKDLMVGDPVTFVDRTGHGRPALLTAIWWKTKVNPQYGTTWDEAQAALEKIERETGRRPQDVTVIDHAVTPSVNVVIVSPDEAKSDPYGRQIERETSVPHQGQQAAHGYYWRMVGSEEPLTPFNPAQPEGTAVAH